MSNTIRNPISWLHVNVLCVQAQMVNVNMSDNEMSAQNISFITQAKEYLYEPEYTDTVGIRACKHSETAD